MSTPTLNLNPSAPLEKDDSEQRLEKKLNYVNSFNNSIKEMITYFKDKNKKSTKIYRDYRTLTSMLESVNTVLIIGASATSVT